MEVKLFNITDDNLRRGLKIELGKVPDNIFMKDPTPYSNLYQKYRWKQIERNLQVKNAEVVDVLNVNTIIKTHEHINNTTNTIQSKVSIFETIENTISSFWSEEGLPEDEIFFDIDYNFNGRAVSYHNRWRKDNLQNASQSFGVSKDGFINIQSGQRVTTRLKGTKTILLIKINYVASLVGNLVVNYAHVYGKYHFWAPNVNDIMKAAGIINEIITTELIEVRCYNDPVLEIFDSSTEKPMRIVTPPTPFHVRPKSRYSNKVKKAHPK
ncbi:unnamed protein product [Parnassius apollo]|uniref:(apollo) hypothetical protein n=1 Tax=Parnassius apollo TaxID=110799 RepID=A0A8S3Y9M7_PARAO|nr:unnamed protein product [Parnassius apollo]